MGKVRTILIKNISKELINKYPDVFTIDFEKNKELLSKYVEIDQDGIDITLTKAGRRSRLTADIPVVGIRQK